MFGEGTNRYAAVHGPFFGGANEEEDEGRDEYKCGDCTNVSEFELAQIRVVVSTEDDKEDVDRHRKRPEHICQWKPIQFVSVTDVNPARPGASASF